MRRPSRPFEAAPAGGERRENIAVRGRRNRTWARLAPVSPIWDIVVGAGRCRGYRGVAQPGSRATALGAGWVGRFEVLSPRPTAPIGHTQIARRPLAGGRLDRDRRSTHEGTHLPPVRRPAKCSPAAGKIHTWIAGVRPATAAPTGAADGLISSGGYPEVRCACGFPDERRRRSPSFGAARASSIRSSKDHRRARDAAASYADILQARRRPR